MLTLMVVMGNQGGHRRGHVVRLSTPAWPINSLDITRETGVKRVKKSTILGRIPLWYSIDRRVLCKCTISSKDLAHF